jgi:hypothetical protein
MTGRTRTYTPEEVARAAVDPFGGFVSRAREERLAGDWRRAIDDLVAAAFVSGAIGAEGVDVRQAILDGERQALQEEIEILLVSHACGGSW